MEVVLLLVGILGVALIVVPRMQRRRGGARKPAPARRRTPNRQAKAQAAATASPVATWTPAEAAASRAGDWEVWDDELGWEGVESAPPTRQQPEPAAEAEPDPQPEPERAPDREAWERFRAKQLSDDGQSPVQPEPAVAGGSCRAWSAGASARPLRGASGPTTTAWAGRARPRRPSPWPSQRDEAAPVRNGNGNDNGRASQVNVTRFSPPCAPPSAPEEAGSAPPAAVAGHEWLSETAWEAHGTPATQTEGGSNRNGNGHATAVAAAPRRGRRRLSPVALVAI